MTTMGQKIAGLPGSVKVGGVCGTVAAVTGAAALGLNQLLIILAGLAALGAAACGVVVMLGKVREKAKARKFVGEVQKEAARTGRAGASDAQERARLDSLRKNFQDGLARYEQSGKRVYDIPWYVFVGPPSSGKTEAIRHSGLKFANGTKPQQGAGGTTNMHWWFANERAVLLDLAGAVFMDDDRKQEWQAFLKMLGRARARTPINGMFLAIDCKRLLQDDPKTIEDEASKISAQLDLIQRTLDVRFPVYVVVTMSDRLPGFREFFDGVTTPERQNEMLGWSNQADLDTGFDPTEIDDHFKAVREKLVQRRARLLLDPVHTRDSALRRADEVDEMFAFPDQIEQLIPRLKRWLEIVFTPGEWSPKPLFLRGIYFNSALQEGAALDMLVAQTLRVSPDELGQTFRVEKSYFIRDLLVTKAFKEKGLVTNAKSVSKAERAYWIGTSAALVAAAAVLLAASVWAWRDLQTSIQGPAQFWAGVASAMTRSATNAATPGGPSPDGSVASAVGIVWHPTGNAAAIRYANGDQIKDALQPGDGPAPFDAEKQPVTRAELPAATKKQAEASIRPNFVFRMLGRGNVLADERRAAHRQVIDAVLLEPVVRRARALLALEPTWQPDADGVPPDAVALRLALAELIRTQTFALRARPAADQPLPGAAAAVAARPRLDLVPLIQVIDENLRYPKAPAAADATQGDADSPAPATIERVRAETLALNQLVTDAYTDDAWPPAFLRASDPAEVQRVRDAVGRFVDAAATPDAETAKIIRLRDALRKFASAIDGAPGSVAGGSDPALVDVYWPNERRPGIVEPIPDTEDAHSRVYRQGWSEAVKAVTTAADGLDRALKDAPGGLDGADAAFQSLSAAVGAHLNVMRAQLPLPGWNEKGTAPAASTGTTEAIREALGPKTEEALTKRLRDGAAELLALNTGYGGWIGSDAPGSPRRYRRLLELCAKLDAYLAQGPPAPYAMGMLNTADEATVRQLVAIRDLTTTLTASPAVVRPGAKPREGGRGVDQTVLASIGAAERYQRTRLIRDALTAAPLTQARLREMATANAAATPLPVASLPLLASFKGLDPAFGPQGLSLLKDWDWVQSSILLDAVPAATVGGVPGQADARRVLGADDLKKLPQHADADAAFKGYADDYVAYWTRDFLDSLGGASAQTWAAFRAAARDARVVDVVSDLVRLGTVGRAAVEGLPRRFQARSETAIREFLDGLPPDAEIVQLKAKPEETLAFLDALGNDPTEARRRLLASAADGSLQNRGLIAYPRTEGTRERRTIVTAYYGGVVDAALRAIRDDSSGELGKAAARVGTERRRPLVRDGDGVILPNEVEQVRNDLALVLSARPAAAGGGANGVALEAYPRVARTLNDLRGNGGLSPEEQSRLEIMAELARGLAEGKIEFALRHPVNTELLGFFECVIEGNGLTQQVGLADAKGSTPLPLRVAAPYKLRLVDANGAPNGPTAELASPWSILDALLAAGSTDMAAAPGADPKALVFRVPIRFTGGGGAAIDAVWEVVITGDGVPTLERWPRTRRGG